MTTPGESGGTLENVFRKVRAHAEDQNAVPKHGGSAGAPKGDAGAEALTLQQRTDPL